MLLKCPCRLFVKIQPNTNTSKKESSIARMRAWTAVSWESAISVARDTPKTIVVTTSANKPPPIAHKTRPRCEREASTANAIAVAAAKNQGAMFIVINLSGCPFQFPNL